MASLRPLCFLCFRVLYCAMFFMTEPHLLLLLFCLGVFLQLAALLCKRLAFSRILLATGAGLICLCAMAERDSTLVVGQLGLACILWLYKGGK